MIIFCYFTFKRIKLCPYIFSCFIKIRLFTSPFL